MTIDKRIGFMGFGNMGEAIFRGLLTTGAAAPADLGVFDVDAGKRTKASEAGASAAGSPEALARGSDVILLATKPQDMGAALDALKPGLRAETLIISIAAGISISFIVNRLGPGARVARVMPNTPALVNACAAGYALSDSCTGADRAVVRAIFEAVGVVEEVPEPLLDVVTGLSGSGPAYFFYFVECLVAAAVAEGLSEEQATRLATQTLLGAGRLLKESGESASILRERVTSKGGTTFAALERFRADGLADIVKGAVHAAAARSRELGQ